MIEGQKSASVIRARGRGGYMGERTNPKKGLIQRIKVGKKANVVDGLYWKGKPDRACTVAAITLSEGEG